MLIIPHYSNNFFTIFTSCYTFPYVSLESIFTPIHSLCPTKGYKYVSFVFLPIHSLCPAMAGWWFGPCFIFPYTGNKVNN